MLSKTQIDSAVHLIAKNFNPEKVYLFGSYAQGRANDDSDLDIAVVLENDKSDFENICNIRMALLDLESPLDILVFKPKDFENKHNSAYSFVKQITNEGILVHGN